MHPEKPTETLERPLEQQPDLRDGRATAIPPKSSRGAICSNKPFLYFAKICLGDLFLM